MTELEARSYLRENGYPEHVCRAGSRGLVESYGKFVAAVEHGYKADLEAYRNDLDLRSLLTLLDLDEQVAELDRRFAALLQPASGRVWESGPTNPFWDFAYPKNASGELLADLKSEGLC